MREGSENPAPHPPCPLCAARREGGGALGGLDGPELLRVRPGAVRERPPPHPRRIREEGKTPPPPTANTGIGKDPPHPPTPSANTGKGNGPSNADTDEGGEGHLPPPNGLCRRSGFMQAQRFLSAGSARAGLLQPFAVKSQRGAWGGGAPFSVKSRGRGSGGCRRRSASHAQCPSARRYCAAIRHDIAMQ